MKKDDDDKEWLPATPGKSWIGAPLTTQGLDDGFDENAANDACASMKWEHQPSFVRGAAWQHSRDRAKIVELEHRLELADEGFKFVRSDQEKLAIAERRIEIMRMEINSMKYLPDQLKNAILERDDKLAKGNA